MFKKWFNKQTLFTFVLGLMLASSITTFAVTKSIKTAEFNTDTKITVDGKDTSLQLVAVTLDGDANGSNYAPVRSVVEAMGGNITYDSQTKTIDISTPTSTNTTTNNETNTDTKEVKDTNTNTSSINPTINREDYKTTPDGYKAVNINGEYYLCDFNKIALEKHNQNPSEDVYIIDENLVKGQQPTTAKLVKQKYESSGEGKYLHYILTNETTILDNIQLFHFVGTPYIKYDDYMNKILPLEK